MKLIFNEGISVDGNNLSVKKLYATTFVDNKSAIGLLQKLGFSRDIPEDGPVLIMQAFVNEEDGAFLEIEY